MVDYNNTPLSDCDGFTPSQMHKIIYYPFDDRCPIKLLKQSNEKLFNECPIFRIAIDLLSYITGKNIKLTPKGNLPLNITKAIYAKNYLYDKWIEYGIIKVRSETDWMALHSIRLVLTLAGFIRKKYNRLSLTKKCESLLKEQKYSEIFYDILKAFTLKFNWAYNDRYNDEKIGQTGFLYILHILSKFGGEERSIKFYADLYFRAFPSLVEISKDETMVESIFYIRFIERFALWFGFIDEIIVEGRHFIEKEIKIKKTNLLDCIFQA